MAWVTKHININFLVRLLLGHPGNVPGTNRACPRDKVGLSQGQTQVFSLLYTVEAQFVPGTNPVCPRDIPGTKGGRKSLCVKSLCAVRSLKITFLGLFLVSEVIFSRGHFQRAAFNILWELNPYFANRVSGWEPGGLLQNRETGNPRK